MENLITDEAKRLKAFRQAENLTMEEFGAVLGKTKSWVHKIEHGLRRIRVDEIRTLREKYNMSYEWFYNGKGKRIESDKEENLIKVTSDMRNEIELLRQKLDKQDQIIKKLARDFYAKQD